MELNAECVRDILLAIEACKMGERVKLPNLCEKLPQYEEETLWYACLKLKEADYLHVVTANALRVSMPCIVEIKDITYQGHEFLNTIREQAIWSRVKDTSKKAGVFSLKALGEIAQSVASAAISAALQQHL